MKLSTAPLLSAWSGAAYPTGLVLAAAVSFAATPPFVQLIGVVGAGAIPPATCSGAGPTPTLLATIDLGATGAYRYSPAVVTPYFFADEGEFNFVYNQDSTLLVSPFVTVPVMQSTQPFPVAPLSTWYAAIDGVPEHTELALRVAAYEASGRSVATSRITWDCTTGQVLSLEHRGTAAGAVRATTPLIEFCNTALDHYFVTADPTEIGLRTMKGLPAGSGPAIGSTCGRRPATVRSPCAGSACLRLTATRISTPRRHPSAHRSARASLRSSTNRPPSFSPHCRTSRLAPARPARQPSIVSGTREAIPTSLHRGSARESAGG